MFNHHGILRLGPHALEHASPALALAALKQLEQLVLQEQEVSDRQELHRSHRDIEVIRCVAVVHTASPEPLCRSGCVNEVRNVGKQATNTHAHKHTLTLTCSRSSLRLRLVQTARWFAACACKRRACAFRCSSR